MSKFNVFFRCPCCNEELDDYEVSMYDHFEGMKEDCFNRSMEAAYENELNDVLFTNSDIFGE